MNEAGVHGQRGMPTYRCRPLKQPMLWHRLAGRIPAPDLVDCAHSPRDPSGPYDFVPNCIQKSSPCTQISPELLSCQSRRGFRWTRPTFAHLSEEISKDVRMKILSCPWIMVFGEREGSL